MVLFRCKKGWRGVPCSIWWIKVEFIRTERSKEMKKWLCFLIAVLLACSAVGCTAGEEESERIQGYGSDAVRYKSQSEYEAEFLRYLAGEDVDERFEEIAPYLPEDYYLMPEGNFRFIEVYYDRMSVVTEEGEGRVLWWNLQKARKELAERIESIGGFNTRYTSEDDVRSYEFTKVTVDGIEYIIERGFSSPKAIAYRESVGNPLTEEEKMYPREMTIYWEQDGALIEVMVGENKKITDDAELVSHYGKLQKVYYNTNDAAQDA